MAWLRIDDRVRTHPKIATAGPAAAWLWFCGICYCREHLTDGAIPRAVVQSLAMNLPSPWKHAAKLVEVRLWEPMPDGYMVHDFLHWNPSKADVMSLRDKERDKKQKQRSVPEGQDGDSRERTRDHAGDAGLGSSAELVSGSTAEKSSDLHAESFDAFWKRYPSGKGKQAALKAWLKLAPDAALIERIHAALDWQSRQPQWTKDAGQFVPHASSWLNQSRFDDEPPTAVRTRGEFEHAMDWVEECKQQHGGACGSRYLHGIRRAS